MGNTRSQSTNSRQLFILAGIVFHLSQLRQIIKQGNNQIGLQFRTEDLGLSHTQYRGVFTFIKFHITTETFSLSCWEKFQPIFT
ncbi:hypothetical protein D3C87_1042060 [compost metagenome]